MPRWPTWKARGEDVLVLWLDAELGSLWVKHRDALLPAWTQEHPGSRPWAWWKFDCPAGVERRKVGGSGQASAALYAERLFGFFDCDPADPPRVESVATFLRRLELLDQGEEKWIPREAWRPVAVEVDGAGWAPPLGGPAA